MLFFSAFLKWQLTKKYGLVRKPKTMIGPPPFAIPSSDKTPDVGNTYWHTSRTHFSRYFGPNDLGGGLFNFFYSTLQYQLFQPSQPHDKAAKFVWKVIAPLKVKITTCLVVREWLPTSFYLRRRHIKPLSFCVFCDNHLESSAHIFLSCIIKRV